MDDIANDLAEIDSFQSADAGLGLPQLQQRRDQPFRSGGGAVDDFGKRELFWRSGRGRPYGIELGSYDGQGCAEFVSSIRGELTLPLKGHLQLLEHVIEGVRETFEFIVRAIEADPLAQITNGCVCRRQRQPLHGAEQPIHQRPRDGACRQGSGNRHAYSDLSKQDDCCIELLLLRPVQCLIEQCVLSSIKLAIARDVVQRDGCVVECQVQKRSNVGGVHTSLGPEFPQRLCQVLAVAASLESTGEQCPRRGEGDNDRNRTTRRETNRSSTPEA